MTERLAFWDYTNTIFNQFLSLLLVSDGDVIINEIIIDQIYYAMMLQFPFVINIYIIYIYDMS